MYVQIIKDWDEFNRLRCEWDAVYEADPEAQLFLSWQWLSDWLTIYPSPWLVLAAKRDEAASSYLGFLPMRIQLGFDDKQGFYNELSLAGARYSDYTGILVRPEAEAETVRAFGKYIKRELDWGRLTLDGLMMSDRRQRAFLSGFDNSKFAHIPIDYRTGDGTDHSICPSVTLPRSWDEYLATLSSNNRQKIRRLMRKLDKSMECRIALADEQSYDRTLKTLLEFWKIKWTPSKGEMADSIATRNYDMLTRCAKNGTLLLPVFFEGERPVAALAILVDACKRSLLFLITGRDESYTAMPSGYLLHAYSIRYAIAHGFTTYDFCKGNEPYKYHFGTQERRIRPVAVHTKTGGNLRERPDQSWLPTMLKMVLDFEEVGDVANAELGYHQISEIAPDDALALYRAGRFMARTGAYREAKQMLSRSVEIDPAGDNAWCWLARSLQSLGDNDAALEACRKVVLLQPENNEAKALLLQLSLGSAAVSLAPLSAAWSVNAKNAPAAPAVGSFEAANVLQRFPFPDPAKRYKL